MELVLFMFVAGGLLALGIIADSVRRIEKILKKHIKKIEEGE